MSQQDKKATVVIVMGVSGCGKSTVGYALGGALHAPFKDGDELHPKANVDKMSHGHPLNDDDRWPWLKSIKQWTLDTLESDEQAQKSQLVITACSSLKKTYRDLLRDSSLRTIFVYLEGSRQVLTDRMGNRGGHFMKLDMLNSQLDTLESPAGEPDVVTVNIEDTPPKVVARAVEGVQKIL